MDETTERKRLSIAELEAVLQHDEDVEIEILPNGEVQSRRTGGKVEKVLTFREALGGEYSVPADRRNFTRILMDGGILLEAHIGDERRMYAVGRECFRWPPFNDALPREFTR